MINMFWVLLALIIGWGLGWVTAHHEVATECRHQGSFYVGKTTFKCVAIDDKKEKLNSTKVSDSP